MIPSAVNLPLSSLSAALHMDGNTFKEKYGFHKPAFDQEVVFYCRSGMRSSTASDVALKNGYKKYAGYSHQASLTLTYFGLSVSNYKGSWLDWTAREGR
jgi:thiosulfate:glutathione sulfurtransferase